MAVGSRDHREPSIKHLSCLIIRSRAMEAPVLRELGKGETVRFLSLLLPPSSEFVSRYGSADYSLTSGRANATIMRALGSDESFVIDASSSMKI